MGENGLIRYNAARKALALAHSVDEVKAIRDKAEAVRAYAVQAKDTELVSMASEIKLRAMRRMGELLGPEGVERAGKGRPLGKMSTTTTLSDLDISRDLSSVTQKIAAIPEGEFEKHIAHMRAEHGEVCQGATCD